MCFFPGCLAGPVVSRLRRMASSSLSCRISDLQILIATSREYLPKQNKLNFRALRKYICILSKRTHLESIANQLVPSRPQPSLFMMVYLPSCKVSPRCTGWYPPLLY